MGNHNPYIEEEQTTQWPTEEEQTTQWPTEEEQTTQWPTEKKDERANNDLQNIHIKLNIE